MTDSPFVLAGGTIHTLDPGCPLARALVIEGDTIAAVIPPGGEVPPLPRHDLEGATAVPGFVDSHTHLLHWGLATLRPALGTSASLEEALERVAARHAELPPDRPLIAEGWDESRWAEPRFPVRADLDRITSRRPVVLRRVCGHMAVANAAALAAIGPGPEVNGESGLLVEEASMGLARVFPPGEAELDEALRAALGSYHSLGVTAVHDMVSPGHFGAYARADARGELTLSVSAILTRPHLDILAESGLGAGWRRGRLSIWGVKFFSDGSLGARTAALEEPYADAPGERGFLLLDAAEIERQVRRAEQHGIPLAIHAIGDRAVNEVVAGFRRALPESGSALGHRIEHLEMVEPAALETMARLGLVASMQPNFIRNWGEAAGLYETRLGARRTAQMNPFRRVLDAGIRLVFGSDAMPAGVLPGLEVAIHPPHAGQRLSPAEALAATTRAAAESGRDGRGGVLARGRRADITVLDGDILGPTRPAALEVRATISAGRLVHSRSRASPANPSPLSG